MYRYVAVVVCMIMGVARAHAEDFPAFKHKQYEGWVEDTGTGTALVKIVPFLLGPNTSQVIPDGMGFNFGGDAGTSEVPPPPEITTDGKLKLSYKIVRSGELPPYTHGPIIAQTGITAARLAAATKTYVRATYHSVTLEIGGEVYASHSLGGGQAGGDVADAFYVPTSNYELIRKLRAGDYRLTLDYSYPIAAYSSLKVDLSATAISNAWVRAFHEVIRTKSTSGGKFLFFDFSREVTRTQVKERVSAGGSTSVNTRIRVELRDPTPDQLARIEAVLGFAKTTREEMMTRHQAAFKDAVTASNPRLAQAHEKYIGDLNTSTPDTSQQLIAALSKLKDNEPLMFMAAGFQMRSGDASSYFRYDGQYAASQTSTVKTDYQEFLIKNTLVGSKYFAYVDAPVLVGAAVERAFEKLHVKMFQTPSSYPVTAPQWAQAVLAAIKDRDVSRVRYAFDQNLIDVGGRIDPNISVDANRNRLLHHAVRTGDRAVVKLLVDNGASPTRKNGLGDTPIDVAADAGNEAMRSFLAPYASRSGKTTITIEHQGLQLNGVQFYAPESIAKATRVPGTKSSDILLEDYPMVMHVQAVLLLQTWVTHLDYQLIRFPHRVLGSTAQGRLIEVQVALARPYRIREGQPQSYRESVGFESWTTGFTVVRAE